MFNLTKQQIKGFLSAWAGVTSFLLLALLFFKEIPENNKDLVVPLVSAYITGSILLVYSYYFGDSDVTDG